MQRTRRDKEEPIWKSWKHWKKCRKRNFRRKSRGSSSGSVRRDFRRNKSWTALPMFARMRKNKHELHGCVHRRCENIWNQKTCDFAGFLICLKLVRKFARNGRPCGVPEGQDTRRCAGRVLVLCLAKRLRLGPGVFGEQNLCERNIGCVEEIEEV